MARLLSPQAATMALRGLPIHSLVASGSEEKVGHGGSVIAELRSHPRFVKQRNDHRIKALSFLQREVLEEALTEADAAYRLSCNMYGTTVDHRLLADCFLMSKIYGQFDLEKKARKFLERASRIVHEAPSPDVHAAVEHYGMVAEMYLRYDALAAERLYREQSLAAERLYGLQHLVTSDCYLQLASFFTHDAQYVHALTFCKKALVVEMSTLGMYTPCVADNQYNVGLLYRLTGRPQAALQEFQSCRKIYEFLYGSRSLQVAKADTSIARTAQGVGALELALEHLKNAFYIYRDTLGRAHVHTQELMAQLDELHVALTRTPYAEARDFGSAVQISGSGILAARADETYDHETLRRAVAVTNSGLAARVDSSAIGHYIPRFFEDALVAAPNNLCVFFLVVFLVCLRRLRAFWPSFFH